MKCSIDEMNWENDIINQTAFIINKCTLLFHPLYSIGQKLGPLTGAAGIPRLE